MNGVPKLVPNLSDKFDYVLTYEMLSDCMKRGILLKRVSRVVGYEKEAFLLPFVKNCVEKRKVAKTDFEKDFYKLGPNSVYGKSYENVREWTNTQVFDTEVCKLVLSDTDSFIYHIQTKCFYKDISPLVREHFDTCNFEPNHPSGIETGVNKKVPRKMKCEFGGKVIKSYRGLRPKCYIVLLGGGSCEKRAKGVHRSLVRKKLKFEHYDRCLRERLTYYSCFVNIGSRNQQITTNVHTKVCLRSGDDKRYVIPGDPLHQTWAWGDHRIPKEARERCYLGRGVKTITKD